MSPADETLFRLRGVHKSYAAPVLTAVHLDVCAGEVHALVGANGAGKSTLAKVISGLVPPDQGEMFLAGERYAPAGKAGAEALAAGAVRGHKPVPIVGLKQSEIENSNHLLELLIENLESFTLPDTPTTVLQDHCKGRMSETDGINGIVAKTLTIAGQAAPASLAIVEVTRRIHAGEIEPDSSNMDLIRELVAI